MGSSAGLNLLRGLFVLLMAAVGWGFVVADQGSLGELDDRRWLAMSVSLVVGVAMVIVDIVAGRRKLAIFSGVTFGVLIGLTIAYALSFGVQLIVDNLLRPVLVGKDTQIPDYVVLISTLGGMVLFGLNGFVIGPVIAALFIAAWDLFSATKETNKDQ